MVHERLEFPMPAPAAVVFDAFHYHCWRHRWDSLVRRTQVVGGDPCPSVNAITENGGAGWLRPLSMRTRFVSYQPGVVAAAVMVGRSFPFRKWAASMRHRPLGESGSLMVYTYRLEAMLFEPLMRVAFRRQTFDRFHRLQQFLASHAGEVVRWQQEGRPL
jgi:hypothetical protein